MIGLDGLDLFSNSGGVLGVNVLSGLVKSSVIFVDFVISFLDVVDSSKESAPKTNF